MSKLKYEVETVKTKQGDKTVTTYEIRYPEKDKKGKVIWCYPVPQSFESKKEAEQYIADNLG